VNQCVLIIGYYPQISPSSSRCQSNSIIDWVDSLHMSCKWLQKPVWYWLGAMSPACSAKYLWAADWQSQSLIVSATEQGLKYAKTWDVDSYYCNDNHLDCHFQNFMRIVVAFVGWYIAINWVGGPSCELGIWIHLTQHPRRFLSAGCYPPYTFAGGQYPSESYSTAASRCCPRQRGCTKSKPIRECSHYLLRLVLLVPWRSVMR